MKRKRLEAWANEYHDGVDPYDTERNARHSAETWDGALRVAVRLVECGPDEVPMPKRAAAVVRAAVRWSASFDSNGMSSPHRVADLLRAVERVKGKRRQGKKR